MNDILSAATLTAFTIAAVRELRRKVPAIDGLWVWLAAGAVGIAVSFIAAWLLGPVDWRAAALRGLAFAAAAVGAMGTSKALTDPPRAPVPDATPTRVTRGASELDWRDGRPSER